MRDSPVKVSIKEVAIDPKAWLASHRGFVYVQPSTPSWLETGVDAIASHDGSVVSAIMNTPDLQIEIILAYLLEDIEIPDSVRKRIFDLGDAIDHGENQRGALEDNANRQVCCCNA